MSSITEGKFQVAVGAIIESAEDGKILLVKRNSRADYAPGIWEFVTGRIKQFEEPEVALRREVQEEAGLTDIKIVKPFKVSHFFRGEPIAEKELILIIYWCMTSSCEVKISEEHEDFQWVTLGEALELVEHPGVKSDIEAFIRNKAV